MDLNTYQQEAVKTAIYPGARTGSITALAYLGLGLGEAGEVQGKIKKIIRDEGGVITDEARVGIMKELGDVLWYVALISEELDINLDDVASANIAKLADRHGRGVLGGSGDER